MTIRLSSVQIIRYPFLLFILLLHIVLFYSSWQAMVDTWLNSQTFSHDFFILPASLWLIWQNKLIHPYLAQPGKPSLLGLGFILGNGFIWLLAKIIHVQVVEQYALVGSLIGCFWFYLGNRIVNQIKFPLAFLYLMVPVGTSLLPVLMDYTADFTVALLRLTGISVYRDHLHFTLVSGKWSVVEACSGLRYLIASITLGIIYAYITYLKTYKRIIFIFFSIVLPIVANGFRAYLIVMIGHLSNMKLAVGVDHLIYGAIFFGLIIFFMFYVGSFWADPIKPPAKTIQSVDCIDQPQLAQYHAGVVLTLIVSLGVWQLGQNQIRHRYHPLAQTLDWRAFVHQTSWHEVNAPTWGWKPRFKGTVAESLHFIANRNGNIVIGIYQANFGHEEQGELINSQNKLIDSEKKAWHFSQPGGLSSQIKYIKHRDGELIAVSEVYWLGGYLTSNPYQAKIVQLYKRLSFNDKPELYLVIYSKLNSIKEKHKVETILNLLRQQ